MARRLSDADAAVRIAWRNEARCMTTPGAPMGGQCAGGHESEESPGGLPARARFLGAQAAVGTPWWKPASEEEEDEEEKSAALAKTRLCKFFNKGACQKGEACTFAHGRQQLQRRAPLDRPPACAQLARGRFPSRGRAGNAGGPPRRHGADWEDSSDGQHLPRRAQRYDGRDEGLDAVAERDAIARQLAEAKMETARLQAQLQLLRWQSGAAPQASSLNSSSVGEDTDVVPQVQRARFVAAAPELGDEKQERPFSRFDDGDLTMTVKNTFVDVVLAEGDSEKHRRTNSVPPRNRWMCLWTELAATVGGAPR